MDVKMLAPALQLLIKQLNYYFPNIGYASGYRTAEDQDALYMQGRSEPGQIVTYARGAFYESQHQWGIAFDFFKNEPGHAYDDLGFFRDVGKFALDAGFGWGGTWDKPDMPHIYIPTWGDTTVKLREIFGSPDKFRETDFFRRMLDVDGYAGQNTISALQLYFGVVPDGYISRPSPTVKKLQAFLNNYQEVILNGGE